MSFQAGNAYITITPSMRGFQRSVARGIENSNLDEPASRVGRQMGESISRSAGMATNLQAVGREIESVGRRVQGVGQSISGVGATLTKSITMPALGAVAAAGGIVAAFGWGRLKSVDTAQAQLRGLGYDTADVERISAQLTDALEGGMLTMGEATSAAAAGMAAGVEEGAELTRYIQLLDAATAGSNGTFDEMNQIFARIQGSGKLMTNELDMMEQRMPGFTGKMAEAAGVTQDSFREMVSAGQVSSDDFLDGFESFGSAMALEYAKSWEGMVQNTKAYIGIIGEALLEGVFQRSKEEIGEFIYFLSSEDMAAWAKNFGGHINDVFSRVVDTVKAAISWWTDLDTETKKLFGSLALGAVAAGPFLLVVGKLITGFGGLITSVGVIVGWFGRLFGWLGPVIRGFATVAAVIGPRQLTGIILRVLGPIGALIGLLIGMWTNSESLRSSVVDMARAVWDAGKRIWDAFAPLGKLIGGAVVGGFSLLGDAVEWVTGLLGDGLAWVIDSVVIPVIGWLADVIVGLIGWLVDLGDESTTQGAIFAAVWGWIKDSAKDFADWWTNTGWPAIKDGWESLASAATTAWEDYIGPAIEWMWDTLVGFADWWTQDGWPSIRDAWESFSDTVTEIWDNYLAPVFDRIWEIWSGIADRVANDWMPAINDAWNEFKETVLDIWNNTLSPIFDNISESWSDTSSSFSTIWEETLKPIWDEFKGVVSEFWEEHEDTFWKIAGALALVASAPVLAAFGIIIATIGLLIGIVWLLSETVDTVVMLISGDWEGLAEKFRTQTLIIQGLLGIMGGKFWWLSDESTRATGNILLAFHGMSYGMKRETETTVAMTFADFALTVHGARNSFIENVGRMALRFSGFSGGLRTTVQGPIAGTFAFFAERITGLRQGFAIQVGIMAERFGNLRDRLSDIWTNGIRPVLATFGNYFQDTLANRIATAVARIASIWEGIKTKFAEPINWVIREVVNKGLIGSFNKVAGFIPGVSDIPNVPQIATRAKGGFTHPGWTLVGEEGPELVNFTHPNRVYTADETKKMLSQSDHPMTTEEAAAASNDRSTPFGIGNPIRDKLSDLADSTGVSDVLDWARGGLKKAAETLLEPIFKPLDSWASSNGLVGQFAVGMAKKVRDEILDWAGSDDEDSLSAGFFDGEFTANPGGFNRPMQGPITSPAGRRSYIGAFGNMHYGVDIGGRIGSAVRAAWAGVVKSMSGGGLNQTVVVNHGGFDTAYMHNSAILKRPGTQVSGGEIIARSGTAGSGPHLHFELHPGGYYNPSLAVNNLFRDKGGLIYPGMNQVLNKTGKAEYVFNQNQFENLNRLAEQGGNGRHVTVNQYGMEHQYADRNAQAFMFAERRESRKVGVR